jgi:EAL domain-containing protein (putative c-di-GMP-specific phosphodiesterase class I)
VSLSNGAIVGAEALVRWNHPDLGFLMPDRFMRWCDQSGSIVALDEEVLRLACRQSQEWASQGLPVPNVSVNISRRQLRRPGFADTVATVLAETGVAPGRVQLEFSERGAIAVMEEETAVARAVLGLGIGFSVDNFGAGPASLSALKRVGAQSLKIDRTLIERLPWEAGDRAFVKAAAAMGHALGMTVVADGVETEAQLNVSRESGCDHALGFLFSPPLPADRFATLLKSGAVWRSTRRGQHPHFVDNAGQRIEVNSNPLARHQRKS